MTLLPFRYKFFLTIILPLSFLLCNITTAQESQQQKLQSSKLQTPEAIPLKPVKIESAAPNNSVSLMTAWGRKVSPAAVHPEYPRPTLVRKDWLNLNGLWDYRDGSLKTADTIRGKQEQRQEWSKILVPFPAESVLSGIEKYTGHIIYRRTFLIPEHWNPSDRIILHFGAVNWDAAVYINGQLVGRHQGGYTPFSFDITDLLNPRNQNVNQKTESAANELLVDVFAPCNQGQQVRGKQSLQPSGIWYTSVSGIWQTVWLEPVPKTYIKAVHILPDCANGTLTVQTQIEGKKDSGISLFVEVFDGEKAIAQSYGGIDAPLVIRLSEPPKLWSPEEPFLYQLRIRLLERDVPVDRLGSYTAFRKIEFQPDTGLIILNGKPYFQAGVIDQGYFPDGLYTAPSDEALQTDIQTAKKFGFNAVRKHVKVEPERWYYWCDRFGMLVWQDIPNGDNRSPESQRHFETEMYNITACLRKHPSVVVWTLFNEGWGQHKTEEYTQLVQHWDAARLVNSASGWTDKQTGHIHDRHLFPGPAVTDFDSKRAAVCGSFGGITLVPPKENVWTQDTWGYRQTDNSESLLEEYKILHQKLRKCVQGRILSAAFFHQLTDVESECNGLMTYDRALLKVPPDVIRSINSETIRIINEASKRH
ncbi:beta-galactosidase [Planctomycetales bacterium]|nr:beta-galactosidase [Planctomycetales bacterium]